MVTAKAASLAGQTRAARDKTPRKTSIAGRFFINIQRLASYIIRHAAMFCRATVVVQTQQPVNVSNAPEAAACQCFLLFGTMDPTSRSNLRRFRWQTQNPLFLANFIR
jgi:hypothetical protein